MRHYYPPVAWWCLKKTHKPGRRKRSGGDVTRLWRVNSRPRPSRCACADTSTRWMNVRINKLLFFFNFYVRFLYERSCTHSFLILWWLKEKIHMFKWYSTVFWELIIWDLLSHMDSTKKSITNVFYINILLNSMTITQPCGNMFIYLTCSLCVWFCIVLISWHVLCLLGFTSHHMNCDRI